MSQINNPKSITFQFKELERARQSEPEAAGGARVYPLAPRGGVTPGTRRAGGRAGPDRGPQPPRSAGGGGRPRTRPAAPKGRRPRWHGTGRGSLGRARGPAGPAPRLRARAEPGGEAPARLTPTRVGSARSPASRAPELRPGAPRVQEGNAGAGRAAAAPKLGGPSGARPPRLRAAVPRSAAAATAVPETSLGVSTGPSQPPAGNPPHPPQPDRGSSSGPRPAGPPAAARQVCTQSFPAR